MSDDGEGNIIHPVRYHLGSLIYLVEVETYSLLFCCILCCTGEIYYVLFGHRSVRDHTCIQGWQAIPGNKPKIEKDVGRIHVHWLLFTLGLK